MKIKKGFTLRQLGNEYIVIGEGTEQINFRRMFSMNRTAARLWEEAAQDCFTIDSLTAYLLDKYQVTKEQAEHDVRQLTEKWKANGLLED